MPIGASGETTLGPSPWRKQDRGHIGQGDASNLTDCKITGRSVMYITTPA